MSAKTSSLAVEEVKVQSHEEQDAVDFEPKLKVLVNKRYVENSESIDTAEAVSIRGRITVSF